MFSVLIFSVICLCRFKQLRDLFLRFVMVYP